MSLKDAKPCEVCFSPAEQQISLSLMKNLNSYSSRKETCHTQQGEGDVMAENI